MSRPQFKQSATYTSDISRVSTVKDSFSPDTVVPEFEATGHPYDSDGTTDPEFPNKWCRYRYVRHTFEDRIILT